MLNRPIEADAILPLSYAYHLVLILLFSVSRKVHMIMDDLVPPNVSHTGADLPLLTPPVLVIEEDFTILEMVIRMLNLAGYSTIACTNRQKILAHLSSLRYF